MKDYFTDRVKSYEDLTEGGPNRAMRDMWRLGAPIELTPCRCHPGRSRGGGVLQPARMSHRDDATGTADGLFSRFNSGLFFLINRQI